MKYSRNWQIGPSLSDWKMPKHTLSTRIIKSLLISGLARMVFRIDGRSRVLIVRNEQVEPDDRIITEEKWWQYRIR
jgi:hypothetical protein